MGAYEVVRKLVWFAAEFLPKSEPQKTLFSFQTLSEKSGLESVLRETQTAFAGLESEMEETQSRLLKALNELDKCKEKQERDEKRISEMHER